MARTAYSDLAWSMEDDEVVAEIAEGGSEGSEEVLNGDETVEGEMLEMDEAGDAVDETEAKVDQLEETAANLEAIYMAMESFKKSGGMSKEVAFAFQVGISNSIAKYPSLTLSRSAGQPALESFGSASTRMAQTVASLEGLRQILSDFWTMIMKQINKLTAYIRNWFLKVLDAAPRLKKRAEAISERAKDTTGTMGEKKVDLSLVRTLSLARKPVTGAQLIAALGSIEEAAKARLTAKSADDYEKTMDSLLEIMEKAVEGKMEEATKGGVSYQNMLELHAKTSSSLFKAKSVSGDNAKRFGDDTSAMMSDEILGGKAFISKQPVAGKHEGDFKRMAAASGDEIGAHDLKAKATESSGQFETLSTSNVIAIADKVADICETIIGYKKGWEGRESQQKRMDTEVKKAISSSEKDSETDGAKGKTIRSVGSAISTGWRKGVAFESSLINFSINVGRASLSYCDRSLGQYKKA